MKTVATTTRATFVHLGANHERLSADFTLGLEQFSKLIVVQTQHALVEPVVARAAFFTMFFVWKIGSTIAS